MFSPLHQKQPSLYPLHNSTMVDILWFRPKWLNIPLSCYIISHNYNLKKLDYKIRYIKFHQNSPSFRSHFFLYVCVSKLVLYYSTHIYTKLVYIILFFFSFCLCTFFPEGTKAVKCTTLALRSLNYS